MHFTFMLQRHHCFFDVEGDVRGRLLDVEHYCTQKLCGNRTCALQYHCSDFRHQRLLVLGSGTRSIPCNTRKTQANCTYAFHILYDRVVNVRKLVSSNAQRWASPSCTKLRLILDDNGLPLQRIARFISYGGLQHGQYRTVRCWKRVPRGKKLPHPTSPRDSHKFVYSVA